MSEIYFQLIKYWYLNQLMVHCCALFLLQFFFLISYVGTDFLGVEESGIC